MSAPYLLATFRPSTAVPFTLVPYRALAGTLCQLGRNRQRPKTGSSLDGLVPKTVAGLARAICQAGSLAEHHALAEQRSGFSWEATCLAPRNQRMRQTGQPPSPCFHLQTGSLRWQDVQFAQQGSFAQMPQIYEGSRQCHGH